MSNRLSFPIAIAALALAMAAALPARADYRAAVSAYDKGAYDVALREFDVALREFQALAQGGDTAAQYNLGLMFKDGFGVQQDPITALGWFICAAGSGGHFGADAARWVEQLSSSLDGAAISTAQERAHRCRAAQDPERPDPSETSKHAGSETLSNREGFDFNLDQLISDLSQVEIARPEGGVSLDWTRASEPARSSSGSFFAVPSRGSVWSKVFFFPADGTMYGSQHVASELGANDLFRDLRAIARDDNTITLGILAVLWWFLIGKALLSVGRGLTSVFRSSNAERWE